MLSLLFIWIVWLLWIRILGVQWRRLVECWIFAWSHWCGLDIIYLLSIWRLGIGIVSLLSIWSIGLLTLWSIGIVGLLSIWFGTNLLRNINWWNGNDGAYLWFGYLDFGLENWVRWLRRTVLNVDVNDFDHSQCFHFLSEFKRKGLGLYFQPFNLFFESWIEYWNTLLWRQRRRIQGNRIWTIHFHGLRRIGLCLCSWWKWCWLFCSSYRFSRSRESHSNSHQVQFRILHSEVPFSSWGHCDLLWGDLLHLACRRSRNHEH